MPARHLKFDTELRYVPSSSKMGSAIVSNRSSNISSWGGGNSFSDFWDHVSFSVSRWDGIRIGWDVGWSLAKDMSIWLNKYFFQYLTQGGVIIKPISLIFFLIFIFLYLTVLGLSCSIQDLVPWPGIEPGPTCFGSKTLSLWTTREAPTIGFCS